MQPKTAAYKRRNGFELKKAKSNWWKRAKHGIQTESPLGPYFRWFVDREERDRVYALLRKPDHPEAKVHAKVTRNEYNEVVLTTPGAYSFS